VVAPESRKKSARIVEESIGTWEALSAAAVMTYELFVMESAKSSDIGKILIVFEVGVEPKSPEGVTIAAVKSQTESRGGA
jgi:hypothetical protein